MNRITHFSNLWIRGLPLSLLSKKEILAKIAQMIKNNSKGNYIIPMNLGKFMHAQGDKKLYQCIKNSSFNIIDGISMKIASRLIAGKSPGRITGIELMYDLLDLANKKNYSVYLFGAKKEMLIQCINQLEQKFHNLKIVGYRDGYSWQDKAESVIDNISKTSPNILFVALGMPQKEYFIHDYRHRLNVNVIIPVGGAFDVIAGIKRRAPSMIQKFGFEWLWRSIYDRTRFLLVAKNILTFCIILLAELWNIRIMKHKEHYDYSRHS